MNTKQLPVDFPEIQGAIYGVALSLDALLLNGIQYGVLQRAVCNGFLQKTASNLLRDLTRLEEQAPHAPATSQPQDTKALAALRAKCQQLIHLVTGLTSFRTHIWKGVVVVPCSLKPRTWMRSTSGWPCTISWIARR